MPTPWEPCTCLPAPRRSLPGATGDGGTRGVWLVSRPLRGLAGAAAPAENPASQRQGAGSGRRLLGAFVTVSGCSAFDPKRAESRRHLRHTSQATVVCDLKQLVDPLQHGQSRLTWLTHRRAAIPPPVRGRWGLGSHARTLRRLRRACASQDAEGPGAASETAANAWNMPESPGFTRPHGSSVALNAAALSADELRRPSALK